MCPVNSVSAKKKKKIAPLKVNHNVTSMTASLRITSVTQFSFIG